MNLDDIDSMSGDPDVKLVESLLQSFLEVAHCLPVFRRVVEIEANAHKLIAVLRALVHPLTAHDNRICARGSELLNKVVVRLDELFSLDRLPVVIE